VVSFRVAGQEILYCDTIEASGGMEWMYPFMDRVYMDEGGVRGSKFRFQDRLVEVEDETLVQAGYIKKDGKTGITYHGMIRKKPWKVMGFGVDRLGIYISSGLDTADFLPICERFGRTRVTQTYRLLDGVLSIDETILNIDVHDTLQGTGHHPWFARRDGNWYGMIPAQSFSPMDDRMLPTGELLPVTNTPFDLRGTLKPLARDRHGVLTFLERDWNGWAISKMYNAKDGTLIEYAQDQSLPFCVIWDKEEKFFAFEGLSSNVNALTHIGDPAYRPVVLAPGESYTMRVKVTVSRKVDAQGLPLPVEQV
jgi:galactose mutarotase-like enzyme